MLRIHYHIDLDAIAFVDRPLDAAASLRRLSDFISEALGAAYPDAALSVTYDTRTGGAGSLVVSDENGDLLVEDYFTKDHIRQIVEQVWSNYEWVVE
jgi:hypothetical protein